MYNIVNTLIIINIGDASIIEHTTGDVMDKQN